MESERALLDDINFKWIWIWVNAIFTKIYLQRHAFFLNLNVLYHSGEDFS